MREREDAEEEEVTRLAREIQIVINSKLRKEIDEAKIVRFIR